MPRFLTPIDLSNLELKNVLLQNIPTTSLPTTLRQGQICFDSTIASPAWNNGSGWNYIYKTSNTHVAGQITEVIRDTSGNFSANIITAALSGNATTATTLQNARNIGISGTKVTATAASFNGSADVNINITALSVAVGEIALTNGSFIVGNGSNVGATTAKTSIPLSGFGAAAADVAMGGNKITGLADPTNAQDAATKAYVDATSQGLDVKLSVVTATTAALTATYVGSPTFTLTNSGTQAALVIDSIPLSVGDRVLVKDQATQSQNGIYVVTSIGSVSSNWVLTRASDFNTSAEASPGSFTFVEQGTVNGDTGWVMTTNGVPTLDTTSLIWAQFSGTGSYTAGRGMVLSGTAFNFAQSSNYTIGDLPYATGTTTIGMLTAAAVNNALISGGVGAAPSWGKITPATIQSQVGLSVLGTAASGASVTPSVITGTANQVLRVNAGGTALAFGALDLANSVTGTVAIANGGTGLTAVGTQYQVLYSNGSALAYGTVDLNNMTSGTLPVAKGGTGTAYFSPAGPTATRTYTFKDQNATVPAFFAGTLTGDSTTATFTVTHNLNTRDVIVSVIESVSPYARIYTDDESTTVNTVQVKFATAPASGTNYRVVVVGY